jgi:hypothetical protein
MRDASGRLNHIAMPCARVRETLGFRQIFEAHLYALFFTSVLAYTLGAQVKVNFPMELIPVSAPATCSCLRLIDQSSSGMHLSSDINQAPAIQLRHALIFPASIYILRGCL